MSYSKLTCPQCQAALKFLKAPTPGQSIRCPNCRLKFLPPETLDAPVALQSTARTPLLWGAVLILAIAAGMIGWRFGPSTSQENAGAVSMPAGQEVSTDAGATASAPSSPTVSQVAPATIAPTAVPDIPKSNEPDVSPPHAAAAPPKKFKTYAESKRPAPGEPALGFAPIQTTSGQAPHPRQPAIDAAIAKGVVYLQESQRKSGSWTEGDYQVGYAALGGLTLLEAGVAPEHPSVQRAAAFVRGTRIANHRVYQVSLAILFLDRLGDPNDVSTIQMLGLQLLAGHYNPEGWGYECPTLTPQQAQQLLLGLQNLRAKMSGGIPPVSPVEQKKVVQAKKPAKKQGNPAALFTQQPPVLEMPAGPNHPFIDIPELNFLVKRPDNSNTQFALLALWAARRHGVPAEPSLLLAAQRLAAGQHRDGGWGYHPESIEGATTPAMTCVGLLGLAMGHGLTGAADAKKTAPADPAITRGLRVLGAALEPGNFRNLYFLWSVERVAVLYNLRTIGNKDWYSLGADHLLAAQQADGSWAQSGYFGSTAPLDTCFAVLFLKRANLVQDLTDRLPLAITIEDPHARRTPADGK